jgi:hypothetical protein
VAWQVVGASVRGTSHHQYDLPCQDAHLYRPLPEGGLLVAVADGAGSAARSGEGAREAVEQVLVALETRLACGPPEDEALWMEVIRLAFQQAREALVELAAGDDDSLAAFATTLTCAVVAGGWLVAGQVGDGAVVARGQEGNLLSVTTPVRGEYANETYFLTAPTALEQLEVKALRQDVTELALMTDGLLKLALVLPDYSPHPPFFDPLLRFAAQAGPEADAQEKLEAFLTSERVSARTDDDKTLVLVAWIDPERSEAEP